MNTQFPTCERRQEFGLRTERSVSLSAIMAGTSLINQSLHGVLFALFVSLHGSIKGVPFASGPGLG